MPASEKHKRLLGNTLLPLNFRVVLNGDPVDLASYTVKVRIEDEIGGVIVADSATGVTKHPTQTFTGEADDDLLTCVGHGVKEGDQIIVATSGTLPTPLAASTRYFATQVTPNKFSLEATPGSGAIGLTADSIGACTFYIVGSCQYDFQAGDVDAAGTFRAWVIIESGSEQHHFPDDELGMAIEIKAVGN